MQLPTLTIKKVLYSILGLFLIFFFARTGIIAYEKNIAANIIGERIGASKKEHELKVLTHEEGYPFNYYIVLKHRVYFWEIGQNSGERDHAVRVKDADPKTFVVISPSYQSSYAKDKHHVYTRENIFSEADPESFSILSMVYMKDKNHVYRYGNILVNADPNSFQVINDFYSKDSNNVFYWENTITDADPNSFEVLLNQHSKDKNHVYYQSKVIIDANPLTFMVNTIDPSYSKDGSNFYHYGKKFLENPAFPQYPKP